MTDDEPPEVLGSLPRTRPHRRSDKRGSRETKPNRAERGNGSAPLQPPAPPGTPAPEPAAKIARSPKPAAKTRARSERSREAKTKVAPSAPRVRGKSDAGTTVTPVAGSGERVPHPARLRQPPQPAGTPAHGPQGKKPVPARSSDLLGTAVQAVAELAEIGLSLSARSVRRAVSRLPRP